MINCCFDINQYLAQFVKHKKIVKNNQIDPPDRRGK